MFWLKQIALFAALCAPVSPGAIARDLVQTPQQDRVFEEGNFKLEISAPDVQRQPYPWMTLYEKSGTQWRTNWRIQSPLMWGPRYVLIANTGEVIAVESMYRSTTTTALVVIDRSGKVLRSVQVAELPALTHTELPTIVDMAKTGAWTTSAPVWLNGAVSIGVAQTQLCVTTAGEIERQCKE